MNDISFELTLSEALDLDDLYLKNKSLISQIRLLKTIEEYEDRLLSYYLTTLLDDYLDNGMIGKYLKAIMKDNSFNLNIIIILFKATSPFQTKIEDYEGFRKYCISFFNSLNYNFEEELKDFL